MNGTCICACVCVCVRKTEGQNVNMCVKCSCPSQTGFSTVFRFRVYYRATYFAEKVHKANVTLLKPFVLNSGIVCDTKEWINGLIPKVYFSVSLNYLFLLTKTPKCCSSKIRFIKYLNCGSLHQSLDLMTQINGTYLWLFHSKQISKFKADY